MATSRLERVESDYLAALYRKERAAVYEMAIRYRQTVKALVPLWEDAYRRLQAAKLAGYSDEYLSGFIWNEYRMARLLGQASQLFSAMGSDVGLVLSRGQIEAVRLATASAQSMILGELGAPVPGAIYAGFVRFPEEQIKLLTGRLQDGSPIADLARQFGVDGPTIIRQELVKGMANGEIPTQVARRMAKALGADYGRLALIARTEMLRVYRDTTLATYQQNARLVKGWRWSSALSDTTCPVCWAMHGRVFPLSERMATHPACRCSMRPVLRPWSEISPGLRDVKEPPTPKTGQELFAKLPPERQRTILGPLPYKAYKQGLIKLPDLVEETHHPDWGRGRRQRSLSKALGPDGVKRLRGGQPPPAPPAPKPKPQPRPRPVPTPAPKLEQVPPAAPVVVKAAPKAKGKPISEALDLSGLPKSGANVSTTEHIRATARLIDGVHGDGELPRVPVSLDASTRHYGVYGSRYGRRVSNVLGDVHTSLEPDYIKLSRPMSKGAGAHPRLTMAHETGHYLDQQYLSPAMGRHNIISGYASDTEITSNPQMMEWNQAVKQSRAYLKLKDMRKQARQSSSYTYTRPDGSTATTRLNAQYLDYATTNRELFARSYAQYIGTRSQDPTMLAELDHIRDPATNVYHGTQWADDDFEPIANAFDAIFEANGGRG